MSYNERYFVRFKEAPVRALGITNALFRLSFREDNYTGVATELKAYQDHGISFSIEEAGGPRGVFAAINPVHAKFRLLAESNWDPTTLYVTHDRQIQVVLLRDELGTGTAYVPHFWGWIQPTILKEDYNKKPYQIEVSAACGLSTLKDRLLLSADGKRLTGQVSLSHVLRTALAQTGHALSMAVVDNLYSLFDMAPGQTVNNKANITRCPLYQTLIDGDAFLTDNGDTQTAFEALTRILEMRGATLRQTNGTWWVTRTEELPGGWDVWNPGEPGVRTRVYSGTDLTAPPSAQPSYNLNHTVYPDASLRAKIGGETGLEETVTGIRIEQDYGPFISKLPNGNFSAVNNLGFPDQWVGQNVPVTGSLRPYRTGTGTEADPYGLVVYGDGDQLVNNQTPSVYANILFAVGSREQAGKIKWTLTGRFKTQNVRAAKIGFYAYADGHWYFLNDTGWKKDPKAKELAPTLLYHNITINEVAKAKPGYASISIEVPVLKGIRLLRVHLCEGEALDQPTPGVQPYVIYERLRLEAQIEGININGEERTIQTRKAKVDTVLSLTLGNIQPSGSPESRVNTLYARTGGAAISNQNWYKPDTNVLGDDLGKPAIQWLAEAYARQSLRPVQTFEDTVFGRLPFGALTVLRFPDILRPGTGTPVAFLITRHEYYPRECEHVLTAVELRTDALPAGLAPKNLWQTPDGAIPMELDEATGLPIDPSLPAGKPSVADIVKDIATKLRGPIVLTGRPSVPGFTTITPGTTQLKGTARLGGVVKSINLSGLRRLIDFKYPL